MVTESEIQQREDELELLRKQNETIVSQQIPQRRFGFRTTPEQQQLVIQRKEQAQKTIKEIDRQKQELSSAKTELQKIEELKAKAEMERADFERAEKIFRKSQEGDARAIFALDNERQREFFRLFINAEEATIQSTISKIEEQRQLTLDPEAREEIARQIREGKQRVSITFPEEQSMTPLPPQISTPSFETGLISLPKEPEGIFGETIKSLKRTASEIRTREIRGEQITIREQLKETGAEIIVRPLSLINILSLAPKKISEISPKETIEAIKTTIKEPVKVGKGIKESVELSITQTRENLERITKFEQRRLVGGFLGEALIIGTPTILGKGVKALGFGRVEITTLSKVTKIEDEIITSKTLGVALKKGILFDRRFLTATETKIAPLLKTDEKIIFVGATKGVSREIQTELITGKTVLKKPSGFGIVTLGEFESRTADLIIQKKPLRITKPLEVTILKEVSALKLLKGGKTEFKAGVGIIGELNKDASFIIGRTVSIKRVGERIKTKRGTKQKELGLIKDSSAQVAEEIIIAGTKPTKLQLKSLRSIEKQLTASGILKNLNQINQKAITTKAGAIAGIKTIQAISPKLKPLKTKTEQTVKIDSKVMQKQFSVPTQLVISKQPVSQREIVKQVEIQGLRERVLQKEVLKELQLEKQVQKLSQAQLQKQLQKQVQKQITKTSPAKQISRVIIKTPSVILPLRPKIKIRSGDIQNITKGFKTFVIKGGKKVFLGGVRPIGKALKVGSKEVTKTLRATFGVIPTKRLIKDRDVAFKPSKKIFRQFKFEKGRKVPLQNIFIQKRGLKEEGVKGGRLAFPSERRAIQEARRISMPKMKI